MVHRLFQMIGAMLALFAAAISSASAVAAPTGRIVAVGDLHGDYAAWSSIARAAGLVDGRGRWSGGSTILVQTGDVVDRGPESTRIVRELMRLQREARRAGGRVVALVGNHEAMNVTDDLRYVTAADYAAFTTPRSAQLREQMYSANEAAIRAAYRKRDPALSDEAIRTSWLAATPLGLIEHQRAWHPQGAIGRWVVSNPAVVQIGDSLFVHGGISAKYAALPVSEINRNVAAALAARETAETSIINDPDGPLWYRGQVPTKPETDATGGELDQVLKGYGARRMVIGHTPNLAGIAVREGGALIQIDTGISAYYGGKPSYLEISNGQVMTHLVERAPPEGGAK